MRAIGYILAPVTKRLVDIDDDALEAAQVALGTGGLKDTVNAALSAAAADSEARLAEIRKSFAAASGVPFTDADRAEAWQ